MQDDKQAIPYETETKSSSVSTPNEVPVANADAALLFLQQNEGDATSILLHDEAYLKRLRRKIDLRIIPLLACCYIMNFLDKVLLNYAQVMGLSKNLQLKGNDFSNASSAFYIAVLITCVLSSYPIQKIPIAKWLGGCLVAWGICTACHAAATDYKGLLAIRIFCGISEAGIPPALMLISGQWYTREEQGSRFAFWYTGMGLAQILGGLLSFAFQHVTAGAALTGWKIMFLVIGVVTILIGLCIVLVIPDTPMNATFLIMDEKVILLEHVKMNQTGIENKNFKLGHVKEALLDFQMWAMFAIVLLQGTGGGALTSYSATLIRSFGFSSMNSALLNMPSGVVNLASSLLCGFITRFYGFRWLVVIVATILGVMGAALMSFLPHSNHAGLLIGIYLCNAIIGATPVCYQWITSNTAGHSKRAFVTTAMNAAFAVGNIVGPQTFKAQDAPDYQSAKVSLVCTWAVSGVVAAILYVYYLWENKRRSEIAGEAPKEDGITTAEAYAGLTDRENKKNFRYKY